MIYNYNPQSKYLVFEVLKQSKKIKIGEIENSIFYDVDRRGKKIKPGFAFSNNSSFWNQFKNITIKELKRKGDEAIVVWAAYWFFSFFGSIVLIAMGETPESKLFWLVASIANYIITIKFRHNSVVYYWMYGWMIIVVFALVFTLLGGKGKKF